MHMSDALISPTVGGAMMAVSAGAAALCSGRLRKEIGTELVPLMGVTAAFVFAAQMVNFTIPATGSSGHLGGGLLMAILLGPHAAFLAMASVLAVQALFFADGGLLALGCNLFNLGFLTCFVAYPFVYRPLAGADPKRWRAALASVAAAMVGLQLGSLAVVLETFLSGVSDLPVGSFLLLMQPIHLAIGAVEGIATAAVIAFVMRVRPEILGRAPGTAPAGKGGWWLVAALGVAAVITAGGLSWLASSHPDGLEWAISGATGGAGIPGGGGGIGKALASVQQRTAVMPDYGLRSAPGTSTGIAGLLGVGVTILGIGLIGLVLARSRSRRPIKP